MKPSPSIPPTTTEPIELAESAEPKVPAAHWSPGSLPSRLNAEWESLCRAPGTPDTLTTWATTPALTGLASLEELLRRIQRTDAETRDSVLVALLERAHAGDALAGRVVLQALLPKAVRVAMSVVRRPDILGDREEALANAVAALWQAVATYPLSRRPRRVAANLALDTLALVQRGHTGSSHFARTFPERPYADLRELGAKAEPAHHDPVPGEASGPADAELILLLAWSVRSDVVTLDEAQLLTRVYGVDGRQEPGPAIAADLGISWPALRQRCHRLARRIGRAAVAGDVGTTPKTGSVLRAA